MVETIFSSPWAFQIILPFLLVFILVFAALEKTKVLGDGKHRINALIALVIGLIVVSFGYAVSIINRLMPFLAICLVIILVFMLLIGMLYKDGSFDLDANVRIGIGIVIGIATAIAVLYFTGAWDWIYNKAALQGSSLISNIIFIVFIIVAVLIIWFGVGAGDGKAH